MAVNLYRTTHDRDMPGRCHFLQNLKRRLVTATNISSFVLLPRSAGTTVVEVLVESLDGVVLSLRTLLTFRLHDVLPQVLGRHYLQPLQAKRVAFA